MKAAHCYNIDVSFGFSHLSYRATDRAEGDLAQLTGGHGASLKVEEASYQVRACLVGTYPTKGGEG